MFQSHLPYSCINVNVKLYLSYPNLQLLRNLRWCQLSMIVQLVQANYSVLFMLFTAINVPYDYMYTEIVYYSFFHLFSYIFCRMEHRTVASQGTSIHSTCMKLRHNENKTQLSAIPSTSCPEVNIIILILVHASTIILKPYVHPHFPRQ